MAGIAKGILERLGLDKHPMEMAVNKLSGGEQAKLALARQLVGLNGIGVLSLGQLLVANVEPREQRRRRRHGRAALGDGVD